MFLLPSFSLPYPFVIDKTGLSFMQDTSGREAVAPAGLITCERRTEEYTRSYGAININHGRSSRGFATDTGRYSYVRNRAEGISPFALWVNDYVCRMNKSRVPGSVATTFTHTSCLSRKKERPFSPSFQRTAYAREGGR